MRNHVRVAHVLCFFNRTLTMWSCVCRGSAKRVQFSVREARAGRAAGVILQLHRRRRRHGRVPAGGDAVGAVARAPPGARRPPLRQPQRVQRVPLRRRAGRHVAEVPGPAVRLRGRRRERPGARARRRQLPQRRLLHPRQQRLRARRRLGPPPRQRVVPVGGARAGVPPRRAAVAVCAARGPPPGRRHAGQRLHARTRPGHQDRRHHLRPRRPPPHRRRLPPASPPEAAHRVPPRHRVADPLPTHRHVIVNLHGLRNHFLALKLTRQVFAEGTATPVAYGVVFTDPAGVRHHVYLRGGAKSEVIVTAGTLGSPQLLMLSGVGPRGELEKHGILPVLDQPRVGQGVADNPMNSVFVPSPVPVALSLVQIVGVSRFGTFIEGVSGSQFGIPLHGRAASRRARSFGMFSPMTGQLGTVPPKERTPEAMRRAAEAMRRLDRRAFRGGFILEKILGPMSTGHVALRSADPDANPAVTFNYFQDPRDVERCVRGIETIERVVRSRAFARFTYANVTAMEAAVLGRRAGHLPVNLLPRRATDTRPLQQYCRETVMTIWHYHGGCHVGAVVDQDYRVLGVRGLRVVDSSTFKYSPGTNPQATVMMLGRYMGLKIQKERWTRNDETH
ncbi:hypothetical protein EE612_014950 [Oryza sativa]|nr:hypothetical protein EE612_014950 [Oryza sativa]